jgi:hypothetical protein
MTEFPLQPDGSQMIGGYPYRMGFLSAAWRKDSNLGIREAQRENVLTFENDVYHYTSIAGLNGIIESGGFWASDNRFLNDSEEITHGRKLASRVLQHKASRSKNPAFAAVLSAVAERVAEHPTLGQLIVCFSRARDSLEQWRGYGPQGAVCLRLSSKIESAAPLFFAPDQLPFKVVYADHRKAKIIISIARRFEREYIADRTVMFERWPSDHDENYTKELSLIITHWVAAFKNSAFLQEQEIRMILHYGQIERYHRGLMFRPTVLGLVPYVCTGDRTAPGKKLPLAEVMVGPSPQQELIAQSISTYLTHKGYGSVQISMSAVPYRSS